jgi:DNA polymerase
MPTIEHCLGCPYPEGCAIGPRGNAASSIVVVGEAPGAKEIEEEAPFRGPAGAVLRKALADAGLSEERLFITNSVACRPFNPGRSNLRTPSPAAMLACHGRLVTDISAHPRTVIVALGKTAVQAVTGQRAYPLTKKEPGTVLPSEWGTVVPTLHPAFVLRFPTRWYPVLVEDLTYARRLAFGPEE